MSSITKEYICVCGKICANSQSFNGHKSHCKVHRLTKGGEADYENYLAKQAKTSQVARAARKKNAAEARQLNNDVWIAEKHFCERCGKLMIEKFGSGRFCSEFCARSRIKTEETRQKISATLSKTLSDTQYTCLNKRHCLVCGKVIKSANKTGVCKECLNNTPSGFKIRQELGRKGYATMQKNGTHRGWQSRNISSYAEQFWMQVLDTNHIKYQREVPVKHNKSNYFLDFVIEHNDKLIDLEIDGKQHTYEDRIQSDIVRDLYLTKQGYLVYRVAWNEISSDEGAQTMKEKIDAFLTFYRNLSLV